MQWVAETAPDKLEGMIGLARQAIRLHPDNAANWLALANALRAAGELDEAVEELAEAVARFPLNPALRLRHAVALERIGEFERAAEAAQAVLALTPDNEDARRLRHVMLARMGELDKAAAPPGTPALRMAALFKAGATEEAVVECRAWLADRPGSTLATYYLAMGLAKLGHAEEARAVLSIDRHVDIGTLTTPSGYDSDAAFLKALAAEIAVNPSLVPDPRGKATRQGRQTRHLRRPGATAVDALLAEIKRAVEAYAARLARDSGAFANARPDRAKLKAWAVMSGAEGHQTPHIHPNGWLSGVFYVAGARAPGESVYHGPLVIGAAPEQMSLPDPPWGTREIEPIPSRIVLFPSYVPHATLPPDVEGERIVIAFDVIPQQAPAKP